MTKVVFVVGAGASKEFGLPTGAELKATIAGLVAVRDRPAFDFKNEYFKDIVWEHRSKPNYGDLLQAGELISGNMELAPSIDNFVDSHRSNTSVKLIAKLAIAKSILDAEKASKLFVSPSNKYNKLNFQLSRDAWLPTLFRSIVAQRDFDEFLQILKGLAFISFNYDRCIHQFFYFAARNYFDLDDQKARKVIERLNVIYPYGTIGPLRFHGGPDTGFGSEEIQSVLDAQSRIRTFTDGVADGFSDDAAKLIEGVERVFFLGFAYSPLNMKIILNEEQFQVGGVYGTSKGLSETSKTEVLQQIERHFVKGIVGTVRVELGQRISLRDSTCADLIMEHARFFESL